MIRIRIFTRSTRLILHLLLGLILTPLVSRADPSTGGKRTNPHVTSWWHGHIATILNLHITTSGTPPQAPALMVANHISWLDIILLGHLTPTCFLSKSEVRDWPVIGWLADRAGTLFIKRGGGQANVIGEAIGGRLERQGLLTLFPEGTTTDGQDVRPFFSRLFGAAIDTGTPIIPVSIRYHVEGEFDPVAPYIDDQSLGENMLGLMRRKRNQVHVHFGEPIIHSGEDRKGLAKRSRQAIVDSLQHIPQSTQAQATSSAANQN